MITTMRNLYQFRSTLEGYINIGSPKGKYNNCYLSFKLPPDTITQAKDDRKELLTWVKTKADKPQRLLINRECWGDNGLVKYSYLGDSQRPAPVFIDTANNRIPLDVLETITEGSEVELIVQQFPYSKPCLGTSLRVLLVQVITAAKPSSLNRGNQEVTLTEDDLIAMVSKKDIGFKVA